MAKKKLGVGEPKPEEYSDEDRRKLWDYVFTCPYRYPSLLLDQNVIARDVQMLSFVAKAMGRPKRGIERQIEYGLIDYDEDNWRTSVVFKLKGLPSKLYPYRPLDDRIKEYYCYAKGDRIKPSKRKTKIGTVNPKRPLSDKKFQILAVLSDERMAELKAWRKAKKERKFVSGTIF